MKSKYDANRELAWVYAVKPKGPYRRFCGRRDEAFCEIACRRVCHPAEENMLRWSTSIEDWRYSQEEDRAMRTLGSSNVEIF